MRTWKNQFDPQYYDHEVIGRLEAEGFIDHSWGNDSCPKFIYEGRGYKLQIWVEAKQPLSRDYSYAHQFVAELFSINEVGTVGFEKNYEGEDFDCLIEEIKLDTPDIGIFAS